MWCDNCGDEIDFSDMHEGLYCETLCCECFREQEYLNDEVFGGEDDKDE